LSSEKPKDKLALKIDFIEVKSYANEAETCMYMGGEKDEQGNLVSFKEMSPEEIMKKSIFSLKQDVKLLGQNILKYGVRMQKEVLEKHQLTTEDFDYFLPHISSYFFEEKTFKILNENGVGFPMEKWFTNLKHVGNVGAASPYLMIEEMMNTGKLKKGDRLILMVPESARFAYVYLSLTVC